LFETFFPPPVRAFGLIQIELFGKLSEVFLTTGALMGMIFAARKVISASIAMSISPVQLRLQKSAMQCDLTMPRKEYDDGRQSESYNCRGA
jgi:hypothetical protein